MSVCRAFIGLTIHAKIIGGGRPLLPEILGFWQRGLSAIAELLVLISWDSEQRRSRIAKIGVYCLPQVSKS